MFTSNRIEIFGKYFSSLPADSIYLETDCGIICFAGDSFSIQKNKIKTLKKISLLNIKRFDSGPIEYSTFFREYYYNYNQIINTPSLVEILQRDIDCDW